MKPLLSVIVPVYNQEKYVEECMDSLFSQADGRVEFILINDGSTDGSAALIERRLAQTAASVRFLQQANQGLIKTRKIGVENAAGDYILFVDSDDALLPGALETLLGAIEAEGPDVILFNATSDRALQKPLFSYPFPDGARFGSEDKYPLYQLICATDKLNNIWAKCIRRELLEDPEVYRDIGGISNGEDIYQSLVVLDRAGSVLFLDKVLYYYRVNMASMSRGYNPKHFLSEKKVCPRRIQYAKKWDAGQGELVRGAERWICRILRDVTRKAFISDQPWAQIRREIQALRADPFYQQYYFHASVDKNKRDAVLKAPLPVMRLLKTVYSIKPWIKRAAAKG